MDLGTTKRAILYIVVFAVALLASIPVARWLIGAYQYGPR
jgi:hypothetical protein